MEWNEFFNFIIALTNTVLAYIAFRNSSDKRK